MGMHTGGLCVALVYSRSHSKYVNPVLLPRRITGKRRILIQTRGTRTTPLGLELGLDPSPCAVPTTEINQPIDTDLRPRTRTKG